MGSGRARNPSTKYSSPFSSTIRPRNPMCRPGPSRKLGTPPARSTAGGGMARIFPAMAGHNRLERA